MRPRVPEAKSRLSALLSPGGRAIWIVLAAVNIVTLYFQWKAGVWLFRADWSIYPHDYIAQWAAGIRVNNGQAALVYNWAEQVALQTKLIGATKPADFYVFYPPHFLFTTPVFTWLGPASAYIAFLCALMLYAVVLNVIVQDWLKAIAAAIAGGGAYFSLLWVQNGFLMGALLIGAFVLHPSTSSNGRHAFGYTDDQAPAWAIVPWRWPRADTGGPSAGRQAHFSYLHSAPNCFSGPASGRPSLGPCRIQWASWKRARSGSKCKRHSLLFCLC